MGGGGTSRTSSSVSELTEPILRTWGGRGRGDITELVRRLRAHRAHTEDMGRAGGTSRSSSSVSELTEPILRRRTWGGRGGDITELVQRLRTHRAHTENMGRAGGGGGVCSLRVEGIHRRHQCSTTTRLVATSLGAGSVILYIFGDP